MQRLYHPLVHLSILWGILSSLPEIVCAQVSSASYFQSQVAEVASKTRRELDSITEENWPRKQAEWRSELRMMLGIPEDLPRTELETTFVGSVHMNQVVVDRLHYQARPGMYVAANLYRPQGKPPADGWPAVLYVCGHARVTDHGRLLGNKTNYQHHGLWLAQHGIVCLTIDTVQLGEFHGEHHGTYKLGRWDWISRGYTPAGVEAWNAIRAVDLLCNLDYVNQEKIGITGRSGGGAYSWFAAALDERIKVAVPVAGITDLQNHIIDGCVEGHCDCMYFVNYFGWDYAKLAALVAPRALLLENSDSDRIFPLDGVMRIDEQLRQLYARLNASERYGLVITPGPHQDTQALRVPAFRWLVRHLTGEDIVIDAPASKEIEPAKLAVFDHEIPQDERVTSLGTWFAPQPEPAADTLQAWRQEWFPAMQKLGILRQPRNVVFSPDLPSENPSIQHFGDERGWGISVVRVRLQPRERLTESPMVHLVLSDQGDWHPKNPSELDSLLDSEQLQSRVRLWPNREHYFVRWRAADWHDGGLSRGDNSASKRNQIVRRFYLLGKTPEQQALADLLTALKWISTEVERPLALAGTGRESLLIHLAAAACSEWHTAAVQELFTDQFPNDPLLSACLPGMLQICEPADVRKLTQRLFSCRDQSPLAPLSTRLLVDTSTSPRQATGMRILEVTDKRATIWVRATRWPLANLGGLPQVKFSAGQGKRRSGVILPESGVEGLRYAVPGVEAEVRVGYRPGGTGNLRYSEWQAVSADSDFSALITIEDLRPGTAYEVRTQVRSPSSPGQISSLSGSFKSLPAPDSKTNLRLAVATCQGFNDRDGPHGFDLYRSMLDRDTDAFVMAGDVVYYDRLARSVELANYHWQRTYSLPTLFEFHRRVPAFFLKDDHDTYVNDSWPESDYPWTEDFTFQAGQRIFQQQTGLPDPAYRTFQVGSDLQLWLMEGRDFRSPNTEPDGPQKTIWGRAQKDWLKETLSKSTAAFKVIISPTPLVGPDRENKRDNHSNAAFETEGREVRQLIAEYPNAVIVCGDRHWQYHSVDPQTGLHEFSVGPASDRHAGGWKQEDYRPEKHRFLLVAGGYLEMQLKTDKAKSKLILRHLDTLGNERHRHVLSNTPDAPEDDSK